MIMFHYFSVNALRAIRTNLTDPRENLKSWKDGDPCKSEWAGVLCFPRVANDGYLHVRVMYVIFYSFLSWYDSVLGYLRNLATIQLSAVNGHDNLIIGHQLLYFFSDDFCWSLAKCYHKSCYASSRLQTLFCCSLIFLLFWLCKHTHLHFGKVTALSLFFGATPKGLVFPRVYVVANYFSKLYIVTLFNARGINLSLETCLLEMNDACTVIMFTVSILRYI